MVQVDIQQVITDLGGIGMVLLMLIVAIIVVTIALKIGINAVKGEKTSLGDIFVTGILMIVLFIVITFAIGLFLPSLSFLGSIVALVIGLIILQSRHNTTFFGALAAVIIFAIVLAILVFAYSYFIQGSLMAVWDIIFPSV
jgi:hypothetical protein